MNTFVPPQQKSSYARGMLFAMCASMRGLGDLQFEKAAVLPVPDDSATHAPIYIPLTATVVHPSPTPAAGTAASSTSLPSRPLTGTCPRSLTVQPPASR